MKTPNMKAVIYRDYGAAEVLHLAEVARPTPKDNEVLIRIHATTVTSGDVRLRKADPFAVRFFYGLMRPKQQILGHEAAGVVEAVGSKVTRFRKGDRVFGSTGLGSGTYAEYICLPEVGALVATPAQVSDEEAATLVVGALTALHFLKQARPSPGRRILIHGASGSIGSAAVQIAKSMGAHVTAVCSTANVELLRSLGADRVIDYTREDFTTMGLTYDAIFSTVGRATYMQCKALLNKGGVFLTSSAAPGDYMHMLGSKLFGGARVIGGVASNGASGLEQIRSLMETGRLKAVIDRSYPLAATAEAHRYVEQGHKKGNVVIKVAA
ncbi:MAG TPA: NAD(P)-dependent alcohol dehydrogenase [Flavobacteriales bacterium]|nr:NAD(P)-dependent alcohol dehydrogenase [Flavobacteriales bacterium]HMR27283.1 NAD(P)-dependent alcohol dehydrogenase [Flavobacteriales bacterium]